MSDDTDRIYDVPATEDHRQRALDMASHATLFHVGSLLGIGLDEDDSLTDTQQAVGVYLMTESGMEIHALFDLDVWPAFAAAVAGALDE